MGSEVRWLLAALCGGLLTGCGPRTAAVSRLQVHRGSVRGVSYEVRGSGRVREIRSADGVTVTMGSNQLDLHGSRAIVNGSYHGNVAKGDSVVLDEQGRLFVDQKRR